MSFWSSPGRELTIASPAAAKSQAGEPFRFESSMAKLYATEMAQRAADRAVQLHGGMGVSEELDIGHHYIRLNMIDRLFGDRDFHLSRYADLTQGTTA